jgi:hypothetical protein
LIIYTAFNDNDETSEIGRETEAIHPNISFHNVDISSEMEKAIKGVSTYI